jgi:hypothetical protein
LDPALLMADVLTNESVIFRRPSGNLIGIVIREFCPDEAALKWIDEEIKEAVDDQKSMRVRIYLLLACRLSIDIFQLEDPGKLVMVRYSAGLL